jgi:cell division septum initiation protein DivIVA
MPVLEDHWQWLALGLAFLLALGSALLILRMRHRSRVAETTQAQRLAMEHGRTVQQNVDLRRRVADLELEVQRYAGTEEKISDTLRLAQSAAAERERSAKQESERIIRRAQAQGVEIVDLARERRDRVSAEVESLKRLREELVASYKAFVRAAADLLEEEVAWNDDAPTQNGRPQPVERPTTEAAEDRAKERSNRPQGGEQPTTEEFEIEDMSSVG